MSGPADRLYELLPAVYRQLDLERGRPLQALLRVIGEQVDVVEEDITGLYENWFIETCEDWVVPYLGALVGYQPVPEAGEPGEVSTPVGRLRNRIIIPRREVANTIAYRCRKGTLALLELLSSDVAGWPARAVELYKLLGLTQAVNHPRPEQGKTVDLREGEALDQLDGPFDKLGHTVDVRGIASHRTRARHNIPSVALFVFRLKPYSVTGTEAYCLEEVGSHCYTFSVLGNDTPLHLRPRPEGVPTQIAGEMNVPSPIRRRAFERHLTDYYGQDTTDDKSLQIWVAYDRPERQLVPADQIVPADLTGWHYRPRRGQVAVDPRLGRIAFPPGHLPRKGVWVSYHYAFSADLGGGEYDRPLSQPKNSRLYRVGEAEPEGQGFTRINDALQRWREENPDHAVIEIIDNGVYAEQINIELREGQALQLRAANRKRPVIRLLDWHTDLPDNLSVVGRQGSCLVLDGLLIAGRGVQLEGNLAGATIRHCTLVPGWTLRHDCEPLRPAEASLALLNTSVCLSVRHSIIGSVQVTEDEVLQDPIRIDVSDSIVDATSPEREALGSPGCPVAHTLLSVVRSTVFGQIQTHAIELAENSILVGRIRVARRQHGCVRFCYVEPGSRTPPRYGCQPDLVEQAVKEELGAAWSSPAGQSALERERLRVRPQFNSIRYGTSTYCQLSEVCAEEIKRGAEDESEMGVFHDFFQPQRAASLRARLDEYSPAGMEAGIVYAS